MLYLHDIYDSILLKADKCSAKSVDVCKVEQWLQWLHLISRSKTETNVASAEKYFSLITTSATECPSSARASLLEQSDHVSRKIEKI